MNAILHTSSRYVLLFSLLTLAFSACKTGQKAGQRTGYPTTGKETIPQDTLVLEKDTFQLDTVELKMYRVLKDTVSIIGVGDIMMGTNFPSKDYLPYNDGEWILEDVEDTLHSADVTFGNLEGVILNEGGEQKHCNDPKLCYLFRTPDRYVKYLNRAGFTVMSLANNHAGDFGDTGRANTQKVLDSAGIYHAGLLTTPYTTFVKDGMRYGFAAFSPNTGTVSINDHENAKAIVAHLDSISDIVIVSFHGGAEGSKHEHVTREREYFYGENRGNVYEFSHDLIDAGADVIFGHGPHVTRAIELYNDRFIIYSMGNFCTYGRFNLKGIKGIAPIIKVYTDAEGRFMEGDIIPTYQPGAGGPKIDPEKKVIKKMQELTEADFPEGVLLIEEDGKIVRKPNN